jgi:hypothetical protein
MMKRPPIEVITLKFSRCIAAYKTRISNAEKTYLTLGFGQNKECYDITLDSRIVK